MVKNKFIPTCLFLAAGPLMAAPTVSRLTPPSELFTSGQPAPIISRFLPGQRFDLQATIQPDAGQRITGFQFAVDGKPVKAAPGTTSQITDPEKLGKGLPAGTAVVSLRAYSNTAPGRHAFSVAATQSDGRTVSARGNFEVVGQEKGSDRPARNVIILLGDGMGAAHRTGARIVSQGYAQGKAKGMLAMDTFPHTAMVMTASLNSIVTDSSPGMSNYVTGNKAANNEEGVWPDDTINAFDNPRVEYLAEYLHRTRGTALGLVTTADVFDATPAANAVHTAKRGYGTGIVDQYLDDRHLTGLAVLMGGGRKWFVPNPADTTKPQPLNGSQRRKGSDYVLPADIVAGWGAAPGRIDPDRDLIADFKATGFAYVPDHASMKTVLNSRPNKLLGLFAWSNMNVAYDKLGGRRGTSTVTADYGFPDQPMLDEMTRAALSVLARQKKGFVLMIEAASIDKQSHLMDSERWLLDTVEFDRAVQVAKEFAEKHPDTLVIATADHECAGAALIGASRVSDAQLKSAAGTGIDGLRDKVVGTYENAGFPRYTKAPDGYPAIVDIDHKILVGYGANADRYETWSANIRPTQDSQQPFIGEAPLNAYPSAPAARSKDTGFLVTGQVPGDNAVHTATDIPLSAMGRGAGMFHGVIDNTDVFFKIMQALRGRR